MSFDFGKVRPGITKSGISVTSNWRVSAKVVNIHPERKVANFWVTRFRNGFANASAMSLAITLAITLVYCFWLLQGSPLDFS